MTEKFNQQEFSSRVKEELEYLGMEKQELSQRTWIPEHRIKLGLRNRARFKPDEVKAIEKVLGMD